MRYENCNPQYIYLLEKIEEQERIIKDLKMDNVLICNKHEEVRYRANQLLLQRDFFHRLIIEFNHLPWYKKMFYKFKL